jgi:hypothetical protein
MNVYTRIGLGVLVLSLAASEPSGLAQAKEAKAQNASGTWKSSFMTTNGDKLETTYKLKQNEAKITGVVIGRGGKEAKIEEGKVEGGKVSFQVTREFNGNKFVIKYRGTLDGDTIKGKVELPGQDGKSRSFDWEAKRQK